MSRVEDMRRILKRGVVDRGAWEKVDGKVIDRLSAQVFILVYERVGPENKQRMETGSIETVMQAAWATASDAGLALKAARSGRA